MMTLEADIAYERALRNYVEQGEPIPLDEAVDLMALGIDVESLTENTIPYTEDNSQ